MPDTPHRIARRLPPITLTPRPLFLALAIAAWAACAGGPAQAQAAEPPAGAAAAAPAEAHWNELNDRAIDLRGRGRYGEALSFAQESLTLAERAWGSEHPLVARSLNMVGILQQRHGRHAEAEAAFLRALAIREKLLGPDHVDVATALNNVAVLYLDMGFYARAEPLYQRSLAIREKQLGPEHPDVASSLSNQANQYRQQRASHRAQALHERALAVREKVLGPDHLDVAASLNNLAVLHVDRREPVHAEALLRRSVAIHEKALGPEHPDLAMPLNNLANLHEDRGDHARAEALHRRCLAIREKAYGPEHPDVAASLNNLARARRQQGDLAEAVQLLQRSVAIKEKLLGPDHPDLATSLDSLALAHRQQGDDSLAELLLERSLAIAEKSLGPDHPAVATALGSLARLYRNQGRLEAAQPLIDRGLAISEKALGPLHPDVAALLANAAGLAWSRQRTAQAVALLQRAAEIEERHFALMLSIGSEAQKSAYADTLVASTDLAVSLHLRAAPSDPASARLAALTVLRRKGRVLDAMSDGTAALRRQMSADDRELLDQLNATRARLAAWMLDGPAGMPAERFAQRAADLETERQDLEARISARNASFREQNQPVTLDRMQQALPPGAALVEWVVYRPVDPALGPAAAAAALPRYAAFVLRSGGDPRWFDLGDAAARARAIAALRATLAHPASVDAAARARRVPALALQPRQRARAGARRGLLSPDARLNLVPFAALRDPAGRLLLQRHTLAYLGTGRDLLRTGEQHRATGPSVIVAAPDFDASAPQQLAAAPATAAPRRSANLANEVFEPLPGARREAAAIARLLPHASLVTGPQATAEAMKQLHGPRILHVATHGFFLPDPGATAHAAAAATENPLLRSGLVLAGANQARGAGRDGILTALEAAGLDLDGTELVVLSACQTGMGAVRHGEGIYGLRRALTMAGARSQVTSLWQVEDGATRELMVGYYQRLQQGLGRAEALRQSQLAMLRQPKFRHPFHWAAFIPAGRWEPLPPDARR